MLQNVQIVSHVIKITVVKITFYTSQCSATTIYR